MKSSLYKLTATKVMLANGYLGIKYKGKVKGSNYGWVKK